MMWIELRPNADPERVESALKELGVWTKRLRSPGGVGLSVGEHSARVEVSALRALPGVAQVFAPEPQCPLLERQAHRPVDVAGVRFGEEPVLLAGPCSVESPEQIQRAAELAASGGARFLRGGAFKPRTSPYAFCGHGLPALEWMRSAADREGLRVVTEVLGEEDVEAVAKFADLLQVGSRNMQNYALLRAVGRSGKPVLLKRGAAARTEEWLLAGEHLLAAGAAAVIFCERGIRSFDPSTRNLLDLSAVALLAHVHGQPVVVDPSHGVGRRDLILPLSRAALACGAHGLLLEVHPRPAEARSDAPQALPPEEWLELAAQALAYSGQCTA